MKNILKFFAVATLGLSFVSCKGFLDEKVTTSFATEHMYGSEAALNADILGCYTVFKDMPLGGYMHEWLQPASGILHWGGAQSSYLKNPLERWSSQLNFTKYSKIAENYTLFKGFARSAYVANALLGALASSTAPSDAVKKIDGEGRFLRAVSYFYLVRLWGDVSCAQAPPTSVSEVCAPRTNFWEVYNFILEDLTQAYATMNTFDEMIQTAGGNASGRVCNYGALAMRSLVFLTIGTLLAHPDDNIWLADQRTPKFEYPKGTSLTAEKCFEHALKDAEEVINKGPFELAKSYAQLFRWGGRDRSNPGAYPEDFQLKERIFVLPRSAEGGGGNLVQWQLPNYYNGIETFKNPARTRPTRFAFQKWCETYGGVKGTASDNKNIYIDCGDPRLKISFAYGSYIGQNGKSTIIYPSTKCISGQKLGNSANLSKLTMYLIKYYDATFAGNTGAADFYVMRYAEVFLIAAEAAAYLSKNIGDENWNKAIGHVNTLLARARKSGDGVAPNVVLNYEGTGTCTEPADWASDKFADKDALLNAIFWERNFELNNEGHEYFDTHRCGAKWLVDNVAKPKNAFFDQPEQDLAFIDYSYGQGAPYGTTGSEGGFRYFEDVATVRKGLLLAYPNDELVYNTELDVNTHDPNKGQNPVELFWR